MTGARLPSLQTKDTIMAAKAKPDATPGDPAALPSSITLNAAYSGFWDDGSHYVYAANSVIYDPDVIAYFVGRPDALYTPAAE